MREAALEVNAEFKLKHLQRGEAGIKGSMVGGKGRKKQSD